MYCHCGHEMKVIERDSRRIIFQCPDCERFKIFVKPVCINCQYCQATSEFGIFLCTLYKIEITKPGETYCYDFTKGITASELRRMYPQEAVMQIPAIHRRCPVCNCRIEFVAFSDCKLVAQCPICHKPFVFYKRQKIGQLRLPLQSGAPSPQWRTAS